MKRQKDEPMIDAINATTRPAHEHLMNEQEAASFLGLSPRTLQRFRVTGSGPMYRRLGLRRVAYLRSDLLAFSAERRFASTSAEDAAASAH